MYYILVFLGLAYERLFERRHGARALRLPGFFAASRIYENIAALVLCVGCLVALFGLRLVLVYQAAHDPGTPQSHVPVPAVYDSPAFWSETYRRNISIVLACVSIASSISLYVLYRCLAARGPRRVDRVVVASAFGLLAIGALLAPAFGSGDPYLYAAYAKLGLHAYAPHAWSERQVMPSLYGPLYLTYLQMLLGHVESAGRSLEILRLTNAAWVMLLVFFLFRLGVAFPILALAMLNPVLWAQYVEDAHNDVIGVTLILAAAFAARKVPAVALFLCAAAGLIKLPFALIGSLAFLALPGRSRLGWAAATPLFSGLASFLWGGRAYVDSFLAFSKNPQFFTSPEQRCIVGISIALIFWAVIRGDVKLSGAYAFPAMGGASAHSWYTFWALPYLVRDTPKLTAFLIFLPMSSFIIETPFQIPFLATGLVCGMTVLLLVAMAGKSKRNHGEDSSVADTL
jgi:hypothetical protein